MIVQRLSVYIINRQTTDYQSAAYRRTSQSTDNQITDDMIKTIVSIRIFSELIIGVPPPQVPHELGLKFYYQKRLKIFYKKKKEDKDKLIDY